MRISRPAVRTLLVSGLLGALALTTSGCQDDAAGPAKPSASSPAATATQSPTPSPSPSDTPSPSATPSQSATPAPAHSPTPAPPAAKKPAAPKPPPKPKMTAPVVPPPMDGGGSKGGGSSVYYKNCTAARAAGVTPLHRGDPGYDSHLDRDGDGIACER
ncbi:excalibur calcium-binding domain-containing protein [Streptomyces sp. NPDC056670]|uniref:excalibur calcium-binding domain-containing protein n=1 Tax=Streptomyces sp. NPDC056670 TaxID=3345904 RepID=UPI00369FFAE4